MSNLEFTFTISPDDTEPYEVTAKSRDIAHWERTFKGASLDKLASNPTVVDLEHLAFVTASRRGKFVGNASAFSEQCDFDMPDADTNGADDDESGPTTQGR